MMFYTEILKNPPKKKKPLELINKFCKVAGYKCIHNCIKKNKIPRNKFNQEGERSVEWKLKEPAEGSWTEHE